MKKLPLFLVMLLLMAGTFASAQKKTITGKVTDQVTGEPLKDVNIVADKTKRGTVSKADGTFSITVESSTSMLLFSYVGFSAQSVLLDGKTVVNVALAAVTTDLNDVIVIGYGTQKKTSVTGAVAKYKNERLDEAPVSRLDQALQGKIAGVQIQNTSSEAGSDPKVQVRGVSSISAGQSPLVVVDGHPVPDGLAFVNMSDVESVEVLKDAASAAIYGSRGATGVILITTKTGKADKPKYSLKMSAGNKNPYKLYDLMTTTQYTQILYDEAALRYADSAAYTLGFTSAQATTFGRNKGNLITTAEKAAYLLEKDFFGGVPVDWQRAALRTGQVKNIDLSVSGGNKDVKYYISGAYQNDQGMMIHSEYERFNVRGRIDAQLSKKVKLTINVNPSFFKRERPATNFTDFTRISSYLPMRIDARTAAYVNTNTSITPVAAGDFGQPKMFNDLAYNGIMPDGSTFTNALGTALALSSSANTSPYSILELENITTSDYRLLTSADLTVNLLPGLNFKSLLSAYFSYNNGLDFTKRNAKAIGNPSQGIYTDKLYTDLLNENTFTYTKQIKDHSFNILAGFTAQTTRSSNKQVTAFSFLNDNITALNTATSVSSDTAQTFSYVNKVGLLSYLGRINYEYKNRYLLSASFRTDGSSKFGPGQKWGFFPAISVGWVASKEKFLNKVDWISNLKLRASYGATGNNGIRDYLWLDQLYTSTYPVGAGTGTTTQGIAPSGAILSNPDITWETTYSYNFGLDLSLFKNAVNIGLDVYQSKTNRLLLEQTSMGITGVPKAINNIGRIQNDGIELEISTNNIRTKNFKWTTAANIAHTKNKLLELGKETQLINVGERNEAYLNIAGGPLIQYYGYKNDGVWLSTTEVNDAKAKGQNFGTGITAAYYAAGALKFKDLNNDNIIDVNDRTVLGSPYPDFTWGITNSFTYKGIDLSFTFQGVQGGKVWNQDGNYNETRKINSAYTANRWISPNNPGDGKTPYYTSGYTSSWQQSDYMLEDASYFALREALVGYTLPQSLVKRIGLNSVRFYFSGQNLFYHTAKSYKGINVEARSNTGLYASPFLDGYQRGAFPLNQTFLFGMNLNF